MLLSKEKIEKIIREYYDTYYDVENLKLEFQENASIQLDYLQTVLGLNDRVTETLSSTNIEAILSKYFRDRDYKVEEILFYETSKSQDHFVQVWLKQMEKKRMKVKNLQFEKALIVVDMVNGFVREGVLHDEEIEKVIPKQYELVKENIREGNLTIFIKDTHEHDSVEHKRFGGTNHCIKGTSECELVDELKVFEHDDNVVSIEKNSTSFMEAEKMRELLSRLVKLKEVKIVGCCTDICVANGAIGLANYFDERNRNVEISVYEDMIETYGSPIHNREEYVSAAKLLMAQQGIQLVRKNNNSCY